MARGRVMGRMMAEVVPARRTWAHLVGGLGFAAAALFFYWPALNSYFASDDWVLLGHYGAIPPAQWWRYFSTDTIWFYRPLQSLQFGLTFQWFGLNERVFNTALLAMHLAVLALGWGLARAVTRRPAMASVATGLFATHWIYVDVIIWKANYNTLQWAAATLAACWCFRIWLLGASAWALGGALILTLVNFFTKEMAVNLPVLFFVLWVQREWEIRHGGPEDAAKRDDWGRKRWGRAAAGLGAPAVMVLAYVGLHRLLIRNIEGYFEPGYRFVGGTEAVRHLLVAWNHAVLGMGAWQVAGSDIPGVFLPAMRGIGMASDWPVGALTILPLLLLAAAIGLRDARLFVGWAWMVASFLPAIFLDSYFASRFFYLPAYGAALALAVVIVRLWDWGTAQQPGGVRALRLVAPVLMVWLAVGNALMMQDVLSRDSRQSFGMKSLFAFLRQERTTVAPGSLIVIRGAPETFFNNGLGAREMAQMALGDPQAEAVIEFQNMKPERIAELRTVANRYIVDLTSDVLTLQSLPQDP